MNDPDLRPLFDATQIRSVDTPDGVRHYDGDGREYLAYRVNGELTYQPLKEGLTMYAIGKDIATGDVMIRNYTNDTAIRIPADDITLVADMIRNEYPECEACEGTKVDGYCTDCGQNVDGNQRSDDRVEAAPPGDHDHAGACVLCDTSNGDCCEHCPGNSAYDQAAVQAAVQAALDEDAP